MKKTLSIAHLSDLHLTATDGGRRKEDGARGMNANLGRILTQPVVREADLVLITGDISDRGELAAWNVLWSSIRQAGFDQFAGLGRLLDEHAGSPYKLIVLHHSPNIPASATSKRRGEKAMPLW